MCEYSHSTLLVHFQLNIGYTKHMNIYLDVDGVFIHEDLTTNSGKVAAGPTNK